MMSAIESFKTDSTTIIFLFQKENVGFFCRKSNAPYQKCCNLSISKCILKWPYFFYWAYKNIIDFAIEKFSTCLSPNILSSVWPIESWVVLCRYFIVISVYFRFFFILSFFILSIVGDLKNVSETVIRSFLLLWLKRHTYTYTLNSNLIILDVCIAFRGPVLVSTNWWQDYWVVLAVSTIWLQFSFAIVILSFKFRMWQHKSYKDLHWYWR